MWDERLKFIKDLVHPSEKDLSIRWELFNQINSFFDKIIFLCLISWHWGKFDNSGQN